MRSFVKFCRHVLITLMLSIRNFCVVNAKGYTNPDWENPNITDKNKEAARATSIPFANRKKAINSNISSSEYFKSMIGGDFSWGARTHPEYKAKIIFLSLPNKGFSNKQKLCACE